MPRKPRIHVPGGVYHVILRGNGRQPIFFADRDRRHWMKLLAAGIKRYRCRIHAYCWMTNHVHMAVQVTDLPLGRFVGWVASQYARVTNRKLGRSGHLFERRYRDTLVADDSYLLQLVRYIHQNPVAAGIVDSPERYPWSSHRAYLGFYRPALLTTDWVLGQFCNDRARAIAAFRQFISIESEEPGLTLGIPPAEPSLQGDGPPGSMTHIPKPCEFAEQSLSVLIRELCCKHETSEADLASPRRTRKNARLRAEIALVAQQQRLATVHEVATRFNRSDSSLSHAIRNLLDARRRTGQ